MKKIAVVTECVMRNARQASNLQWKLARLGTSDAYLVGSGQDQVLMQKVQRYGEEAVSLAILILCER